MKLSVKYINIASATLLLLSTLATADSQNYGADAAAPLPSTTCTKGHTDAAQPANVAPPPPAETTCTKTPEPGNLPPPPPPSDESAPPLPVPGVTESDPSSSEPSPTNADAGTIETPTDPPMETEPESNPTEDGTYGSNSPAPAAGGLPYESLPVCEELPSGTLTNPVTPAQYDDYIKNNASAGTLIGSDPYNLNDGPEFPDSDATASSLKSGASGKGSASLFATSFSVVIAALLLC